MLKIYKSLETPEVFIEKINSRRNTYWYLYLGDKLINEDKLFHRMNKKQFDIIKILQSKNFNLKEISFIELKNEINKLSSKNSKILLNFIDKLENE